MRYCLSWYALALILLPAQLPGQEPASVERIRLKHGQQVRLLTVGGQRLEAPLGRIVAEPPGLTLQPADTGIPLATIDSLWVRRSRAGKGAWIGALVLGVPSAVFWTAFCNAVSEGMGCDALDVVAGLTLAGAAAGAGVGALIGSTSTHWELRYPIPRRSALGPRPGPPTLRVGLSVPIP
jgi:hypothetical protein